MIKPKYRGISAKLSAKLSANEQTTSNPHTDKDDPSTISLLIQRLRTMNIALTHQAADALETAHGGWVHAWAEMEKESQEVERLTRERDECLKHCNDDEGYEAIKTERDRLRAALELAKEWIGGCAPDSGAERCLKEIDAIAGSSPSTDGYSEGTKADESKPDSERQQCIDQMAADETAAARAICNWCQNPLDVPSPTCPVRNCHARGGL